MALIVKTTGLEQYAPGGEARVKLLNIGGPGVGKTRFASFFPKPIFADCEAGLASVADRRVPYVSVATSVDMLDLLNHLRVECRLPKDKRNYETVVIDTLDAYQRKLKQEWMDVSRKEAFTGWEAWGFLNQKMGLLLTRLLNLDMNVIVNVHYKDKTTKDDETGVTTHELMLQLQGETADTAFNDFDLVGWTGTYWEAENGERVQKRGITFKPTPDKPFLKDRLHVTPTWIEIFFRDNDYQALFSRIAAKVDELEPSETVGQIESIEEEIPAAVATPAALRSGALPEQKPAELPLAQLDKPTLAKKARELGITVLPNGTPIKGNTLKAELIEAIEAHQASPQVDQTERVAETAAKVQDQIAEARAKVDAKVPAQVGPPPIEQVPEGLVDKATGELLDAVAPLGERALQLDEEDRRLHDGPPAVLESVPTEPTVEEAVATVAEKLGGQVVAEEKATAADDAAAQAIARHLDKAAEKATEKAAVKPAQTCEDCGKDISPGAGENQDYVKLAWIKYRKKLCADDYAKRKQSA